jgi:hypothetical protein
MRYDIQELLLYLYLPIRSIYLIIILKRQNFSLLIFFVRPSLTNFMNVETVLDTSTPYYFITLIYRVS